MTDFWNRQNNLFEFCSHLTAGVQEESVENKILYLFTGSLLHFSPRKGYLLLSAKNTLSNQETTDPIKI